MDKEKIISDVLEPVEKAGFNIYFVGGCVRDELNGKTPHDYDIATDARPEDIKKIFGKISNMSANSEKYGVTMPVVDGEVIEIATFRNDKTEGRHPDVELGGDMATDASRRDFTMNALYMDAGGNIYDPTGLGIDDAKGHIIRFVGDMEDRIREDPLRMYRFIRFMSDGYKPFHSITSVSEIQTLGVADFSGISKERKLKEIERIFIGEHFMDVKVQEYMSVSGIADDIGLGALKKDMMSCQQSWKWHSEGALFMDENGREVAINGGAHYDFSRLTPKEHGNVWDHTELVTKNMLAMTSGFDKHRRFLLVLAALLHDIGKPFSQLGTKTSKYILNGKEFEETLPRVYDHAEVGAPIATEFCKKLGLSNADISFVTELVRLHMRAHQLAGIKDKYKILSFVSNKYFDDIMLLARADEAGCVKTVDDVLGGVDNVLGMPAVAECIGKKLPPPLLTGDDLIARGLKPSPSFKKKLEVAHRLQVNEGITDKAELFKKVKSV